MKIVKLEDLYENSEVCTSIDIKDVEIVDIRDTNIEENNILGRGCIIFNQRVSFLFTRDKWWIGCASGLRVTFEDGSTTEFTNLMLDEERGNRENIDAAVEQLNRLVFGNGNVTEEPESDMPDIF